MLIATTFSSVFAATQVNSLPANLSITTSAGDIINFNSTFNDVTVHFYIVHDTSHTYSLISTGFNGYSWNSLSEEYWPFNLVNCTLNTTNDASQGLRWTDKTQPVEFDLKLYKINNFGFSSFNIDQSTPDLRITEYQAPIPAPVTQGYTNLEAGNIVYFDLGTNASYDISIKSEFYSYSGVLSGTWPDDNRRYGFVNELPTANTNFAESAGTSILWSDDTDGQTILGTNNKGVASISGTTSGRYMWIINPLYNNKYYDDALNSKAINGVMKIYGVPSGTTVYTYKLKQNATSLGLDNVIPSVSGGVGTVSENEGEQTPFTSTDDKETPYTQTVGGDTSAPETVSAIEGVRQTLDQFVNAFLNLLTAPSDHIQQLISAGSAFMQAITGIFTWLPNSVVDVFTSALILMIVIGVLKMLL